MQNSENKNIFQHMEDFLAAHSVNPVTLRPVLVAKDVTFGESCFDHSYNLLVPLAMENTYVYIKTYICDQTNLPKNVIVVAEIPKIEQEGGNYFFTPPQVNNEKWKLTKGARYVPRMLEFFSPLKNPNLYAAVHNPNILLPPLKIYDTDKVQYQSSSGYVEILHQSTSYEGGMYSYLLLKSCRSKSAESSATAPRVFTLLNEEFEYFKEFLDWAQRAYTISLGDASIEQVRVRAATLGIHNVLNKRKTATTQSSEKQPPMKRGKKTSVPRKAVVATKPRQSQRGTNETREGINAESMMTGLKALGRQQSLLKTPAIEVQPATNQSVDEIIDIEENAQVFDYTNAYE